MKSDFGSRPLALAGKEIKVFFRDGQMLFFSLALPVVLVFLMVAAFGGRTQFHATAYVVNLDRGELGAVLVERLGATPEVTVELLDEASATRRLTDSNILTAIIIPADFSDRMASGQAPDLLVRRRGTGGTEGQVAISFAAGTAREIAGEQAVAARVAQILAGIGLSLPKETVTAKVAGLFDLAREEPSLTVLEETVGARADALGVFLPGMVTMFTLFAISLTSVNIVHERRNGTLERLMTTRLSRRELLAGSWLGTFGRGLLQVTFFFALAWVLFRDMTPAVFLQVMVFGVVAVASVSGLGLVIASLSKTADQANWTAVFLTMVMSVLGGSFFEVSASSGVMGVLSRLTYNFWANDGFRRIIVRGESLSSPAVIGDMGVLLAIAAVGWIVALIFFQARGDER